MRESICNLEGGSVAGEVFTNPHYVSRQHTPIIPDLGKNPEKKLTFLSWAYGLY